jgi:ABC-type transport system substrate-binding protein
MLPFKICLLIAAFLLVKGCQDKKPRAASDTFTMSLDSEPTTINPITSVDVSATAVHNYTLETLLDSDPDTAELRAGMAERWEISADKKVFTFHLRPGMKWHDGHPVTAEDVKFSYDEIFNPEVNAANRRPYFENIKSVEVVDPLTVRFTVKNDYFQNFDVAANMLLITPKHFYGDKNRRKEHNKVLVGSGPYKITSYEKGKRFVLEQNPDWWGRNVAPFADTWHFKRVVIRFVTDRNVGIETFKKGDLDLYPLTPEDFTKKAVGEDWGKKFHKVQTTNKAPKGFSFVAWNLKHPILADLKVRRALAMAYPRDMVMEKFNYNLSFHADGPVYNSSDYHSPNTRPIGFDLQASLKLLREAGWADSDGDGILDKNVGGKKTPLSLTILEPGEDQMKYITVFKEEARKIGVDLQIKAVEWNSFIKLIDERKFDAVRLAWGAGSVDIDQKQIWHTDSQKGGSNFIGYSNKMVDQLIDQARVEYDKPKRIALNHRIAELIAADAPYLFLFSPKFVFYAHQPRVVRPKDSFVYEIGYRAWTLSK